MLQQIITLTLQDTILKQTFSSDVVCLTLKSRIARPLFYIYGVCLFHSTVEPNSFPHEFYVESVESEVWQSHRERLHESYLSNTISFYASLFYLKCIAIVTSIKAFSLVSVYFPK